MVRTSNIGKKEVGPVKRNTLGQKLYSKSKWFGSKLVDVSSKAALLAVPVIAGVALSQAKQSNPSFPSAPTTQQSGQMMSYERYKNLINQNT